MENQNDRPKEKSNEKVAKRIPLVIWLCLAVFYLVFRFGFTQQLDALGTYASYIFELCNVIIAILLAGRIFLKYFSLNRQILYGGIGSLIFGFLIYKVTGPLKIHVPFDLKGTETIIFLLIVAPILEELIFRFFLWQPVEWLTNKPWVAWISSGLLFSYSHLHSMWFVPEEIHSFIFYQTVYTLLLGLGCGYFVLKNKSILGAILVHFSFNLGFYLASTV